LNKDLEILAISFSRFLKYQINGFLDNYIKRLFIYSLIKQEISFNSEWRQSYE